MDGIAKRQTLWRWCLAVGLLPSFKPHIREPLKHGQWASLMSKSRLQERHGWNCEVLDLVELVFKSRSTTFIQTLHQGTTQTWSMASMASKRGLLCPRHDNSANEGMAKQCQRRGRVFEVYGQLLVLLKLSPRITIGGCNWTYARWRLSSLQEKNWEAGRKLAETEKP